MRLALMRLSWPVPSGAVSDAQPVYESLAQQVKLIVGGPTAKAFDTIRGTVRQG
jgi:hypothetical protein